MSVARALVPSPLWPPRSDVLVAAGFVIACQLEAWLLDVSGSRAPVALVALGYSVPLAWRRRAPLAVQAAVFLAVTLLVAVNSESGGPALLAAMTFATYSVARETDLPVAPIGLALPTAWFWAMPRRSPTPTRGTSPSSS